MTWKDLWTEFLLKTGVPFKQKRRLPTFNRDSIERFRISSGIIRHRIENDLEQRLKKRSALFHHRKLIKEVLQAACTGGLWRKNNPGNLTSCH
jgi:hypothetical protein